MNKAYFDGKINKAALAYMLFYCTFTLMRRFITYLHNSPLDVLPYGYILLKYSIDID